MKKIFRKIRVRAVFSFAKLLRIPIRYDHEPGYWAWKKENDKNKDNK